MGCFGIFTESREIAETKLIILQPHPDTVFLDLGPRDQAHALLKLFVFALTKTKKNIDFSTTLAFSFCFHLSTLPVRRRMKTHTFLFYPLPSTLKRSTTLMDTTVYDYFFGAVFKSLRLSTLEAEPFLKRRVFKRLHL